MRITGVIAAIALALALQTTLARFVLHGPIAVDLVLVAVVYVAMSSGPVTGLLAGTAAGLIQDTLAASGTMTVIGIGGLAKTVVGFLTGVVATQFIVTQPVPRFVLFFAATVVHAAVFMGLYALLDVRHFGPPAALVPVVGGQALGNAVVGVVAFQLVELLPGAIERRRAARHRIRR